MQSSEVSFPSFRPNKDAPIYQLSIPCFLFKKVLLLTEILNKTHMRVNKPYKLATSILIMTQCIDHWVVTVEYGMGWSLGGNC